ncbi:hypothetical protein L1887_12493 [Cichorium endivia]|nr:hypothetical protein L1887_12493 [Cichorium endivia]
MTKYRNTNLFSFYILEEETDVDADPFEDVPMPADDDSTIHSLHHNKEPRENVLHEDERTNTDEPKEATAGATRHF